MRSPSETSASIHGLVGQAPPLAAVRHLIEKAAGNRLPVLLLGETGTGKEVVARAIHAANPRGQFVPIDCGALVGTLMESELFGHTKGSFSGAIENKKGLVELADGGTAFFDEIGDLPVEMQVKLLRLVQEREFRPVGALQWHHVDLRVIAATHRNLKAEVAAGRFRQDLYYRLNVFRIHLPPLREHKEDIPLLISHFRETLPPFHLVPETLQALMGYEWPGNVRELKNCIERMSALSSQGAQVDALPSGLMYARAAASMANLGAAVNGMASGESAKPPRAAEIFSIRQSESQAIRRALDASHGERGQAARLLGMGRTTLYRKMKQYGIR